MWEAVVAAERQVTRCRADFYQAAESRAETLRAALTGSNWERRAAFAFLQSLPDDVPILLDQLVELALSHRWAPFARRVISGARRDAVLPALGVMVTARLVVADPDEYRRLAELTAAVDGWETLREIVRAALQNDDPDVREVGVDFTEKYGGMLI